MNVTDWKWETTRFLSPPRADKGLLRVRLVALHPISRRAGEAAEERAEQPAGQLA